MLYGMLERGKPECVAIFAVVNRWSSTLREMKVLGEPGTPSVGVAGLRTARSGGVGPGLQTTPLESRNLPFGTGGVVPNRPPTSAMSDHPLRAEEWKQNGVDPDFLRDICCLLPLPALGPFALGWRTSRSNGVR